MFEEFPEEFHDETDDEPAFDMETSLLEDESDNDLTNAGVSGSPKISSSCESGHMFFFKRKRPTIQHMGLDQCVPVELDDEDYIV